MTRPTWWPAIVLSGTCALVGVRTPSAQTSYLDLPALLTAYSTGRFDAVRTVERAGDTQARELRQQWALSGRKWIDTGPTIETDRRFAAAAFALETEMLRAERNDWHPSKGESCAAHCVLEWARALLIERGAPDEAERLWLLAAVALAQGVRDWGFLDTPVDSRQPLGDSLGFLRQALARFPGDPQFRLDRALAIASRFNTTTDGAARSAASPLIPLVAGLDPAIFAGAGARRETVRAGVVAELSALGADPAIGAEARVRLGYLHWATGRDEAARVELEAAASAAVDPDVRYLAHYLLGVVAQARGDVPQAIAGYAAALDARPGSQSASLALAALELHRGDATRSVELARASLAGPSPASDPWRQFLYGRYPRLPALVARLRAAVKP